MTRDELYNSERGEREYYETKGKNLKVPLKLPITKDGCEAILEIASKALDLPLDEQMRQDFAGWIHHTDINVHTFTLGELGKVLWNRMAKTATWKLDQEAKARLEAEKERLKLQAEAKGANEQAEGQSDVQGN